MKKHFTKKIIIMALAVVLVSVCACIAIFATESTQTYGETLDSVSASVGGKVSLNFNYTTLGTAENYVAEVYKTDNTLKSQTVISTSSIKDNTITVSLTPSEMANTVNVYPATVENGEITARGEGKSYSVKQYALDVIASNDEKHTPHHNTMRALLNWGAMAEKTVSDVAPPLANVGLYTRGTNPISGVTKKFATTAGNIVSKTNDAYGCALTFDINENTFNFYFTGLDNGQYTAYVSKDGGEAKSASVVKGTVSINGVETGAYKVGISNVGVAVYDKTYTVEIKTANNESVIKASGNVLYYLSELAFAPAGSENAKYNDIAKSMYQLYTLAMNKTPAVTPCEHDKTHWRANGAGASYIECSACFEVVNTYAVSDSVELYYSADKLMSMGSMPSKSLLTENGQTYMRVGGKNATAAAWWDWTLISNSNAPVSGRYMIMKLRLGKNNGIGQTLLKIYTSTQRTELSNESQGCAFKVSEDGQWHTVVVDLATLVKNSSGVSDFLPAADGTYTTKYLSVRPFSNPKGFSNNNDSTNAVMDIAYIAYCDTLADAAGVAGDNLYEYSVSQTEYLPYDKETLADLNNVYDLSPYEIADPMVSSNANATIGTDPDGTTYVRVTRDTISSTSHFTYNYDSAIGKSGRFLMIKYRTDFSASKWMTIRSSSSNTAAFADRGTHSKDRSWVIYDTSKLGQWQVYIIDMRQNVGWNSGVNSLATAGASAKYFSMDFFYETGTGTVDNYTDIAYIKWVDTPDEAYAIADGESIINYGYDAGNGAWKSLTFVPDEFVPEKPQDPCDAGHTLTVSGNVYTCSVCGASETRSMPPASGIQTYVSPINVPNAYNASKTGTKKIMYEDGVFFARLGNTASVPNGSSSYQTACVMFKGVALTSGRYVVVKYRTNCSTETSTISMYVASTGGDGTVKASAGTLTYAEQPTDGEWKVVYFDIVGTDVEELLTQSGRTAEVTLTMTTNKDSIYYLDVAYAAVVDTYEQAEAFLEEGEALSTIGARPIAEYNKDLEDKITDKGEKELQFLVFADVHTSLYSWNRIVDYYNAYSEHIDFALHAGDYVGGNVASYVDLYGKGKTLKKPIFNVVGNHDTMPYTGVPNTADDIGDVPQADVFNMLFATSNTWGVTFMDGENTMAYYIDYADQNIRFIALDNYYNQEEQKVWLKNLLDEALENNMHVLTCMHQASGAIVTPVNTNFHTTMPTSGFEHSDFDAILGDFIKAGGKFIANLAGHWHIDLFGYTANGVLNIAIETASPGNVPASQLDGRPQTIGTRNYDAFDVITVNAETGTFELVRIGNNTDGANRTKSYMTFDYITGRVVSENGEKKANWESSLSTMTNLNGTLGETQYDSKNNVSYREYSVNTTNGGRVYFTGGEKYLTSNTIDTGRYLVIKYRTNGARTFSLRVYSNMEQQTSEANIGTKPVAYQGGGEWRVDVIDLSTYTSNYTCNTKHKIYVGIVVTGGVTTPTDDTNMVLDIAFAAIIDDIADIKYLLEDGETYYDCGTLFTNAGAEFDRNNNCIHSTWSESRIATDNGDGTTTYSYNCSGCGLPISSHTVPSDLVIYSDLKHVIGKDVYGSILGETTLAVDDDGTVYTHIQLPSDNSTEVYTYIIRPTEGTTPTLKYGEEAYLVVKYRMAASDNDGYLKLQENKNSNKPLFKNVDDEWQTVVIDIAAYGYKNITQSTGIIFRHYDSLDIAYAAIADNLDDARALLADGETYFLVSGSPLEGDEYDKNGTAVSAN